MFRHVRVTKDGVSRKMFAAVIAGAIAEWLTRFEIDWTKKWETATVIAATLIVGFLFPEKGPNSERI